MALTDNIVAYWRFDEPAPPDFTQRGIYNDATARGNTLTVQPDGRPAASTIEFRLGTNANGNQPLDGSLAAWGKWNRLLTAAEKTALNGGEIWPFSTTTSLQDAVAFYKLDEASNSTTYADATGRGNTLTRTGSVTQVAGPGGIAHGARFSSSAYLASSPATADLKIGTGSFTVFGWFNLATKPSGGSGTPESVFWGQIDLVASPQNVGYVVYYQGFTGYDTLACDVGNGVDLYGTSVVNVIGSSPTAATWYPALCEYNGASSIQGLSFNGGASTTFPRNVQPSTVTGIIGKGAHFTSNPIFTPSVQGWDASTTGPVTRASAPASADTGIGNNGKTVWFWIKSDNTSTLQTVAGYFDSGNNHIDWLVQITGNVMYFLLGNNAGTFQFCNVTFNDTSAWHLVVIWFDKVASIIHINLDHGAATAQTTINTFTPATSALDFFIGAAHSGSVGPGLAGANQPLLGALDEMGIANGTPITADLDQLWNAGAGWTYPYPEPPFVNPVFQALPQ